MLPFRTILCPIDFSEGSDFAWQLAFALARDHGARLVALHVAEPPPFVTHGELQKVLQGTDGYRQELEERLRQFRAPGLAAGLQYRVEDGDPATEIMHAARAMPCDLIVMGTHGRSGIGRLLIGSVAEKVLRRAPCPVLTVKPPHPES